MLSVRLIVSNLLTVKEEEGKTLWLDNQSHASSSVSSSDEDVSWQWPTSFWTQFKVFVLLFNIYNHCILN